MTKTFRVLSAALLPVTLLLASCGSTPPVPGASVRPQNADICPSCGRPALSAWVWPAALTGFRPVDPALGLVGEDELLEPAVKTRTGAATPAIVGQQNGLTELTVTALADRSRPVACFEFTGAARPDALGTPTVLSGEARNLWTGGTVALSQPVWAADLGSPEHGDRLCQGEFGPEWQMLRMNQTTDLLPSGVRPTGTWATTHP